MAIFCKLQSSFKNTYLSELLMMYYLYTILLSYQTTLYIFFTVPATQQITNKYLLKGKKYMYKKKNHKNIKSSTLGIYNNVINYLYYFPYSNSQHALLFNLSPQLSYKICKGKDYNYLVSSLYVQQHIERAKHWLRNEH